MKAIDDVRNEKGFILILALVVMAAMTAIGLAIITSSTTDLLIARNETEAKKAFYLAQAGVQEALGRMALIGNARYIGENSAQKIARINNSDMPGGSGMYTSQSFTSSDLSSQSPNPLQNLNGTYSVTVQYALADGSSWCYGPSSPFNTCNGSIILYGQDWGFLGTGVPKVGIVPLFQIDSVGTTASGSTATIREYVTASSLNVIPPAGNVFANTTNNPSISSSGANNIVGTVSGDYVGTGCGTNCTSVAWPGSVDMNNYLGIPTTSLKQYATPPSPYTQTNDVTYSTTGWGTICSTTWTGSDTPHICDNPAAIIYIDNAPPSGGGKAKVQGGGTGRGILVITGDFQVDSNFTWEGDVYIMGNLLGAGTVTVFGDIMANGTINFSGHLYVYGSNVVAASVAEAVSLPRELRWAKR